MNDFNFSVAYAMRMAKKYSTENKYNHAARVATYVSENTMIPYERHDFCIALAFMHDLIEDTEFTASGVNNDRMYKCLQLVTKPKDMDYNEYCLKIKKEADIYPEAYWVKMADMKDHLAQKETLTDKLRDKYLSALPVLL
jgi:(p)ppGpp synthase/HD superfamily hydrolase